jgi:hypothetical protein
MKFSKNKKDRSDGKPAAKRPKFRTVAVLAAGLALAGCPDTINNHYYAPDGGQDCNTKKQVVECPNNETSIVRGWMNQGESIPFSDLQLRLDDISVWPSDMPPAALLTVLDSQDNVLTYFMLRSGESDLFELPSQTFRFVVNEVQAGYTFGAKRIEVEVLACTQ